MSTPSVVRQCVVVNRTPEWVKRYADPDAVKAYMAGVFADLFQQSPGVLKAVEVVDLPSRWRYAGDEPPVGELPPDELNRLILGIALYFGEGDERTIAAFLTDTLPAHLKKTLDGFVSIGADLPVAAATHWCPGTGGQVLFGRRSDAGELINLPYLRAKGLDGAGVNVVVLDQGVDRNAIPANYKGGWTNGTALPGTGDPRGHGMMIVRSLLDAAPMARIFDCPLIPRPQRGVPASIPDVPTFLGNAWAAWARVLLSIWIWRLTATYRGPWILVNAWTIYDRVTEVPKGDYTERRTHFMNQIVDFTHDAFRADVIFCAGNCGLFCPDFRCGEDDCGPGRSILGANSLDKVLTLGAVRSDTTWIGSSSQGPGQPNLGNVKPDLCAPSQFAEDDDAFLGNLGTSASAAVAAGVVAALRQRWGTAAVSPDQLKACLIATALKTQGPAWNGQIGHGIIDAERAFDCLERLEQQQQQQSACQRA